MPFLTGRSVGLIWPFACAFFWLLAGSLAAQDADFPPPASPLEIEAVRAQGRIDVDGRLDERDWQRAPVTADFFRMEPRQGGTVRYPTRVRVLYDDRQIYFGVFCYDSLGKRGVRAQDLRRDFRRSENDFFGVQIDAQNLKQYCVSFQTTPFGNQSDLQDFNDTYIDNDWNALWTVRTHRTDSGYFAELAIPFKSIRYDRPSHPDSVAWNVTFMRLARRNYELSAFPAIPQSFTPYRMTYAAKLRGLRVPPPSANVRIEPYALYQYDRIEEGEVETIDRAKLGGDVKWAINPNSVLDLTFNTDFAQADVDRAVNNLERFNIFFPERRQFFLENSGIWASSNSQSVVPFFSRRIGLQGDQDNFNAEPAPLPAGARYTMRNERRSVAGLLIRQAATDSAPAANFLVGRYLHNYGAQNNVGAMLTHRMDERLEGISDEASHNTTLTVDGFVRPRNQVTVSYMLSGARDNSNDTLGLAGKLYASYRANRFYLAWLTYFVTEDYVPDVGFVFQRNVIWHSPGGYYVWRPKNISWIRRMDPGIFVDYYHDANNPGNFQQADVELSPLYVTFTNGAFLEYTVIPTWQNINFTFRPLGIPIAQDDYYFTRQRVALNTDRSAKVSAGGSLNWGPFYNGTRTTYEAGLRLAPSVHAALTLDYEYNRLRSLGAQREDLNTHLTTLGTRLALNPRIQLSVFYQYNTFTEQGRWNVRGSWEYRPLSFVYLVFNDTRREALDAVPFEEQQFIGKLTFVRQF